MSAKKILVPTDFSETANNAVRYALAMNKNSDANFLFFHAGKTNTTELQKKISRLQNGDKPAPEKINYIAADLDFNLKLVTELVKEHNIDLIIMGTRGESTPFPAKIFGRNTAAIIEYVEVPVIAVPSDYIYKGISRIAYASDLIKLKQELETVVALAKSMNASVDVFHVTPVFPDIWEKPKKNVDPVIDEVKKEQSFPYIKYHVEETERDNQVKKGIDNYIEEHPVDLLVIFHISRSWIDRIITPSSTVKEISHIKIPILVFPKKI